MKPYEGWRLPLAQHAGFALFATGVLMAVKSMNDLFLHTLKDIYYAE
jgi:hypothetical protein